MWGKLKKIQFILQHDVYANKLKGYLIHFSDVTHFFRDFFKNPQFVISFLCILIIAVNYFNLTLCYWYFDTCEYQTLSEFNLGFKTSVFQTDHDDYTSILHN